MIGYTVYNAIFHLTVLNVTLLVLDAFLQCNWLINPTNQIISKCLFIYFMLCTFITILQAHLELHCISKNECCYNVSLGPYWVLGQSELFFNSYHSVALISTKCSIFLSALTLGLPHTNDECIWPKKERRDNMCSGTIKDISVEKSRIIPIHPLM